MQSLLHTVTRVGTAKGINVVAFSGGVDSSLVSWLVRNQFPHNSMACIGLSAALPQSQLLLAREIAEHVGIPLHEVPTNVCYLFSISGAGDGLTYSCDFVIVGG